MLVAVLLAADVTSPEAYGLCLVAGPLVAVVWPSALRFSASHAAATGHVGPLAFLTASAAAQLISQVVLTGGPVLLALSGGSPREVTAMFAALALFRAPYMLALGAAPQLTARVTRRSVAGRYGELRALVRGVLVATAVAVALAGVLGAAAGPALLRLFFGDTVDVSALDAALLAMGCTLAVTNLVLMVVAMARDRAPAVARAWALATAAGGLGFVALSASNPVAATAGCFLVAEASRTGGPDGRDRSGGPLHRPGPGRRAPALGGLGRGLDRRHEDRRAERQVLPAEEPLVQPRQAHQDPVRAWRDGREPAVRVSAGPRTRRRARSATNSGKTAPKA